ncbi:MAG: hypothetical protein ACI9UA_002547 [Pseudoalteromonas tetraodonis]|jgi:hypothetical protein
MAMKFPNRSSRYLLWAWMLGALCASDSLGQDKKGTDPGVKFHSVKFYEHGAGDAARPGGGAPGSDGDDYASNFPLSSTRHVAGQIVFENLRHGEKASEYEVVVALYSYDNQLIHANKRKLVVPSEWKFAWVSQGYGWEQPGRWSVGTYRVKVWLGKEKVGDAAFYIKDDAETLAPGIAEMSVRDVQFYEGGGFFRPGPAEEASTTFARSKARRIYWVLGGVNKLHGKRVQRPNIVGYYYRPDGTLLGEAPNRFLVPPEVKDVTLVEGLGWATPGSWEPGKYRFELEQDHRVVAEKSFEITDPFLRPRERPQVIHYGIINAGVFAGSETPPVDEIGRGYATEFSAAETDVLWAELVVVNNPNQRGAHSHKLSWQCLRPDGSLLSETETDFTIQPQWKTARQSVPFAGTGEWQPGAYKIRLVIDGKLARVLRFEIGE